MLFSKKCCIRQYKNMLFNITVLSFPSLTSEPYFVGKKTPLRMGNREYRERVGKNLLFSIYKRLCVELGGEREGPGRGIGINTPVQSRQFPPPRNPTANISIFKATEA
jgi:hypothetical protein